jgi:hypothetical protein
MYVNKLNQNNFDVLSTTSTCLQIKIDMHTSDWSDMDLWIGNFRHLPNRPENIMSLFKLVMPMHANHHQLQHCSRVLMC